MWLGIPKTMKSIRDSCGETCTPGELYMDKILQRSQQDEKLNEPKEWIRLPFFPSPLSPLLQCCARLCGPGGNEKKKMGVLCVRSNIEFRGEGEGKERSSEREVAGTTANQTRLAGSLQYFVRLLSGIFIFSTRFLGKPQNETMQPGSRKLQLVLDWVGAHHCKKEADRKLQLVLDWVGAQHGAYFDPDLAWNKCFWAP